MDVLMSYHAKEIKELISSEDLDLTEYSDTPAPVSYTHLDVYKRQVYTRVTSVKSPWLMGAEAGQIHTVPVSHGEGRFVADAQTVARLMANGQIATQYVDLEGNPSMDIQWNPNGSVCAIEGITSPDGRILGKMGHSERQGENLYGNVPGEKDQQLFASGVRYFK